MPFVFRQLYAFDMGNKGDVQLVLGVREVARKTPDGTRNFIEWIFTTGLGFGGGSQQGKIESEKDGLITVKFTDPEAPATARFRKVTFEYWQQLGVRGHVLGYGDLSKQLKTEADLVNFYINEFMPDGWVEDPET